MNSKDGIDFAMLFTLKTTRKVGGLQILRSQGQDLDWQAQNEVPGAGFC